jgi:hypothetical protein
MLDAGVCATIEELAKRERVNRGYMSRVLRLTLLAPDVVEAILEGRQTEGLRFEDLLDGFPVEVGGAANCAANQKAPNVQRPRSEATASRFRVSPGRLLGLLGRSPATRAQRSLPR